MGARAHSRGDPPEVVEEWKCWVVDDIVLIDDDDLLQAMKLSAETIGLLLGLSEVAGLAGIRVHDLLEIDWPSF